MIMNTRITLFLLFFISAFSSIGARAPQFEDMRVGWVEINILGATNDSKEQLVRTIQSRMKTKQGEHFSQSLFDADLKMLVKDYDRIEPQVEIHDGKIHIRLNIWPNPTIKRICWEGNERIRTSKLKSELDISEGTIYDRQKFNDAFHNLKAFYIKKGFFEAELDYTVTHDEDSNCVTITICVNEGRAGKIKDIVFCNFTKQEQECILEMMVTKKYNFFLSWLMGTGVYNDEMILHDKFQILNYIQNSGYADAKVDLQVKEAKQDDRIIIEISVDRGKRYYFDEITLEGNKIYSDEQLFKCIPIKKGDPYSPDKVLQSVQILSNYYGKNGYIDAFVNYIPKLNDDGCSYKIKMHVEEGDLYRVGMIKVIGNKCTKTKVILHETLLVPGEVFDLQKLKITEARLCNIGYFESVNVYAVKSSEDSILPGCYRDVHIEVEEASTGNIGASIGFSTAEDVFTSITVTECNFNICGLRCFSETGLCGLRGGGEFAHLSLSFGAKSSKYAISWTKPYFLDTPWSVGFDIDRSRKAYISDDYSIYGVGLALHATYECNAFMRTGTHYRIRYSYNDVEINCDDGKKPTPESQYEATESDGIVSALGYTWQYNTTNHPICPTKGLRSTAQLEIAGLGGNAHYISFAYLNCWYYDLWGKAIFKLRGDLRFIQPMRGQNPDLIPLDERFFLGGDNLIRGYYPYHLGPKFNDQVCADPKQTKKDINDPRGGISMRLFSAELSKPLFGCGDAFVFFDAGGLSADRWDFDSKYYMSAGIGARLQVFGNGSPPLMVGYGWPINPDTISETKKEGTIDEYIETKKVDVKRFFITVGGKF